MDKKAVTFTNKRLISFPVDADSFRAGGMEFYIYDEQMCFERIVEFQEISSRMVSGQSHTDHLKFIKQLYADLTRKDGNVLEANGTAQRKIFNHLKTIESRPLEGIMTHHFMDVYNLCAQFIYTEGEDMRNKVDPTHLKKKIQVWREHCDFNSFFFLTLSRLKPLAQRLRGELVEMIQKEQNSFNTKST